MKANKTRSLVDKLVKNFGLNPVFNENGELLISHVDVERVFDRYGVWIDIESHMCSNKFYNSNFFESDIIFPLRANPLKEWSDPTGYHMTLSGFIFLIKDYPEPVAQRFMIKYHAAVAQQDLLLKNEEFILYRASQILLGRADTKTRKFAR